MADTLSKFDKQVADAVQTAADFLEEQLVRSGVARPRATAFIENRVEFVHMPGDLKINARCGKFSTRGASDNSLIWFARELHCEHKEELGGEPQYIRNEKPPESEAAIAQRERVEAASKQREEREYGLLVESHRKQAEAFRQRVADANRI